MREGKTLETLLKMNAIQHNTANNCGLKMAIEVNHFARLSYKIVNCFQLYRDFYFSGVWSVIVCCQIIVFAWLRDRQTQAAFTAWSTSKRLDEIIPIQPTYTTCRLIIWSKPGKSKVILLLGLHNVNKPHVTQRQK